MGDERFAIRGIWIKFRTGRSNGTEDVPWSDPVYIEYKKPDGHEHVISKLDFLNKRFGAEVKYSWMVEEVENG